MFELHSQEAHASARALSIMAETNTGIPNFTKPFPNWWWPYNNEEQIFEAADFFKVNDDHLLQGQDTFNITWNVGLIQYRSRFETASSFKGIKDKNLNFTGKTSNGKVYRYGHFTEGFKFSNPQFTNLHYYSFSKFMGIRIFMKETNNLLMVEHDRTSNWINMIGEIGGTLKFFDLLSKLLIVVAAIIWLVKVLKCDRAYSRLKKIERMITPVEEDYVEQRENVQNALVIDDQPRPSAILMEPLLDNQDTS